MSWVIDLRLSAHSAFQWQGRVFLLGEVLWGKVQYENNCVLNLAIWNFLWCIFCSDAEFCTEGVRYLSQMVEKSYFVPVVQCLFYVTPMFYCTPSYLTANSTWVFANNISKTGFVWLYKVKVILQWIKANGYYCVNLYLHNYLCCEQNACGKKNTCCFDLVRPVVMKLYELFCYISYCYL